MTNCQSEESLSPPPPILGKCGSYLQKSSKRDSYRERFSLWYFGGKKRSVLLQSEWLNILPRFFFLSKWRSLGHTQVCSSFADSEIYMKQTIFLHIKECKRAHMQVYVQCTCLPWFRHSLSQRYQYSRKLSKVWTSVVRNRCEFEKVFILCGL